MKTRKIIPLLAIAAVAVFALAGCDALLESIYPEQTTPPPAPLNTIVVEVMTDTAVGVQIDKRLIIELVDTATNTKVASFSQIVYWDGAAPHIYSYANFNDLEDGSYYANAFYDINGDGVDPLTYPDSSTYTSTIVSVAGGVSDSATVNVP